MSFTKAPNANPDAQILAKKPTKLGGQRRRRGGLVLALCTTFNKKPPVSGGSAAGAGGMLSLSAKPPDGLPLAFCTTCK